MYVYVPCRYTLRGHYFVVVRKEYAVGQLRHRSKEIFNNRLMFDPERNAMFVPRLLQLDFRREPADGAQHATTQMLLRALNFRPCKEGWLLIPQRAFRTALCGLPDCELGNTQLSGDSDFGGKSLMDPLPDDVRAGLQMCPRAPLRCFDQRACAR